MDEAFVPVAIETLLAFDGPNIIGPQSAVLLRVRCVEDWSRRIRTTLKEMAQRVGLVVGFLDGDALHDQGGWRITVRFTTPLPELGRAVAHLVVDELRAWVANDEEWDKDSPLYELGRRRRQEAAPVPLLQLRAEALRRGVPFRARPDGSWQLGTGARGWRFDLATLLGRQLAVPPWDRIGTIPINAFAGGAARRAAIEYIGRALGHSATHLRVVADLDHDAASVMLADQTLDELVAGVSATTIATRGAPFDHCSVSAILDLEGAPPTGLHESEWTQALGVPMLVTDERGYAMLNADDPRVAALAQYAPCSVVLLSGHADNTAVAAHRATGGAALFVRKGVVIQATGDTEQQLGALPSLHGAALLGALAAGCYLQGLRERGIDVLAPWDGA